MAKIFFTVNAKRAPFPISWINELGEQCLTLFEGAQDPGQACKEFTNQHPGAQFLSWREYDNRLMRIAWDKESLAAWNRGAKL